MNMKLVLKVKFGLKIKEKAGILAHENFKKEKISFNGPCNQNTCGFLLMPFTHQIANYFVKIYIIQFKPFFKNNFLHDAKPHLQKSLQITFNSYSTYDAIMDVVLIIRHNDSLSQKVV